MVVGRLDVGSGIGDRLIGCCGCFCVCVEKLTEEEKRKRVGERESK